MSNAQLAMAEKSLKICKDASAQKLNVTCDFSRIILPCRMLIAGPTMSGKSEFILNLIKYRNTIFDSKFDRIIYCIPAQSSGHHYAYIQRMTHYFPDLHVIEGLPKLEADFLLDPDSHKLVIMDDLVHEMLKSKEVESIFTVHSHHSKLSISKSKKIRII